MGRMLLPQLVQGVNGNRQRGSVLGLEHSAQNPASLNGHAKPGSKVNIVSSHAELSTLLDKAKQSCAVIFFTSATCPPCKVLYPLYDQLAEELDGKATLIKIDISQPQAGLIASQYSVRATPTLVTFLRGEEENRWTGADPATLRGNIQLLVQMAFPLHPHQKLRLPSFSNPNVKPVSFSKVPPLPKLMAKMGDHIACKPEVVELKTFIEERAKNGPVDTVIPNAGRLAGLVLQSVKDIPIDILFTIVDLFRCALVDPRVSGYFAEEREHKTVRGIVEFVNQQNACPYALRLVTLQMACNLFSTPLFGDEIMRNTGLRVPIIQLISSSFLDESHSNVRVAASSLLFNVALADRESRRKDPQRGLPEEDKVELAASVVEAIAQEENSTEALQGMLSALGHLVYCTQLDGELADLLRALDAEGTIASKKKSFPSEKLVAEVGSELIGKGLRNP